jgi:predicted NBD/HSP70 family sugar kinase
MSNKKELYKKGILKQFYFSGALSCSDLSERMNKSLPFITKLIGELVEEGSIIETGFAPSTGGRRPLCYNIKPDTFYIIAVSMDQLVTRIALMDVENKFVGGIKKIDMPLKGNGHILDALTNEIVRFLHKITIDKAKIIGIGIGMPGFIEPHKGVNYSFINHSEDENIKEYISERVSLPVFIDNDSSLIALAESRFGAAVNEKNAMVINISWGVGLGLIINGELYRGEEGFAGEFSHIPIFTNDKLCGCGKSGCLETETSLLVLSEKAKEGVKAGRITTLENVPFDQPEETNNAIVNAALRGDRFAVELLSDIGSKIGRGVAILIHLLNPSLIVLSGRGAIAGKIWQAPIQQALNEHCIPILARNARIKISDLNNRAELIGAASLVIEHFEHLEMPKSIAQAYSGTI